MNIILPELGEGIESVDVTEVCVKKGGLVKKNNVLLIVESEKASMEIPSESNGKVVNIFINKGDTIKTGDCLFEIDGYKIESADKKEPLPKEGTILEAQDEKNSPEETDNQPSPTSTQKPSSSIIATPSVRKLARELGCDLNDVIGSEKNNRITKE